MSDKKEVVVVAARHGNQIELSDGRTAVAQRSLGPDGEDEEVIRLGEVGPVATGGVVRVCHMQERLS